jgi:predicted glycoside hydrolase/deacetylase ChbG (UPF0249 family)
MNIIRITADDFGATKGVNDAVILLHNKKVLSHAALMVTGSEVGHAINLAKSNKSLEIGLHFVLTDEKSLGELTTLGKNGYFFSRKELLKNIFNRRIDRNEIENELNLQIQEMINLGVKPSFINSHQHIHTFPIVSEIVVKVAKKYNLYVRCPSEKIFIFTNPMHLFSKLLMFYFVTMLRKKLKKSNVDCNDGFISNFYNNKRDFSLKGFENCLPIPKYKGNSSYIWEWMVHPSISEDGLENYWYYDKSHIPERLSEFQTLNSKEFKKICHSSGFCFFNFLQVDTDES